MRLRSSNSLRRGAARDFTGTWQGMLVGAKGQFRTVIRVSKGNGAVLIVSLYIIDRAALENPGSMAIQGSNVRISIAALSGTFDGKLSANGSSTGCEWEGD
jgi:hypothetical protein